MAVFSETKINLTALQRVDPSIVEILDSASQVALYKYNVQEDEWEVTDIKGSLFLYKRSQVPYHGFVIMNTMNTTNQVEPFVSGLDFHLKEPYLLYRNSSDIIYGIWFYDAKDYSQVTGHIQTIVKSMKGKGRLRRERFASDSDVIQSPKSQDEPSILCLLNDAQQKYEKESFENLTCEALLVDSSVKKRTDSACIEDSQKAGLNHNGVRNPRRRLVSCDDSAFPDADHDLYRIKPGQEMLGSSKGGKSVPSSINAAKSITKSKSGYNDYAELMKYANLNKRQLSKSVTADRSKPNVLRSVSLQDTKINKLSSPVCKKDANCIKKPIELNSSPLNVPLTRQQEQHCPSSICDDLKHMKEMQDSNKKHFANAFLHMLKEDDNMLTKIHEAYICSLQAHIHSSKLS